MYSESKRSDNYTHSHTFILKGILGEHEYMEQLWTLLNNRYMDTVKKCFLEHTLIGYQVHTHIHLISICGTFSTSNSHEVMTDSWRIMWSLLYSTLCVPLSRSYDAYRSERRLFTARVPVYVWTGWPEQHTLQFNREDHNERITRGQEALVRIQTFLSHLHGSTFTPLGNTWCYEDIEKTKRRTLLENEPLV